MFPVKAKTMAVAVMALGAGCAHAADEESMFKVSGFGTLAAIHSTEKNADVTFVNDQPNGAGRSRNWDFAAGSKLAVQLDAQFSRSLSGVVQVLAEQRFDNGFTPGIQMANLKWQATDSVSARVGRLPVPVYLVSDYQKVGYSLPWVTGPAVAYQANFVSYLDGADVTYKTNVGDWAISARGLYGSAEFKQPNQAKAVMEGLTVINFTVESGASVFNFGRSEGNVTITSQGLTGFFNAMANRSLAQQYEVKNHHKVFTSLGYSYDPGSWFLTTEMISIKGANDFFPALTSAYATAGYRLGAFTPYVTVSRQRRDNDLNTGDAGLDGLVDGFTNVGYRSSSLGLRWDFMKNVDLKLQLDHVSLDGGSHGVLKNFGTNYRPGGSYNVFTAAVDFVF